MCSMCFYVFYVFLCVLCVSYVSYVFPYVFYVFYVFPISIASWVFAFTIIFPKFTLNVKTPVYDYPEND